MKRLIVLIFTALMACTLVSCDFGQNGGQSVGADTTAVAADSATVAKDSLVQCKGITKRGTQCERMLWWPDTLCFQHKGQADTSTVK